MGRPVTVQHLAHVDGAARRVFQSAAPADGYGWVGDRSSFFGNTRDVCLPNARLAAREWMVGLY